MKRIRLQHGLQEREISFKELRSAAMSKAIPGIMRAADRMPGLLFTLVVGKGLPTIMGDDSAQIAIRHQLDELGYRSWRKPKDVENFGRVLHSVSYWLTMLGREGMGVFWMTDHDNIIANEVAEQELSRAFAGGLAAFDAPLFSKIGLAKDFGRTEVLPFLNDALAIADLTAGAMSAYFTQPMHPDFHSNKTEAIAEILTLHSHQGVFLKKLTVVIQQGPTGEEVALLTVAATKCPKEGYVSFEPPETR